MNCNDLVDAPGRINIEDEDITLNKVKLAFVSACEAAAATTDEPENVCSAIYNSGADCVIGWKPDIGEAIGIWTNLFLDGLERNLTIYEAAAYADDFDYDTYYGSDHDNEDMANREIYGNGAQRLKIK